MRHRRYHKRLLKAVLGIHTRIILYTKSLFRLYISAGSLMTCASVKQHIQNVLQTWWLIYLPHWYVRYHYLLHIIWEMQSSYLIVHHDGWPFCAGVMGDYIVFHIIHEGLNEQTSARSSTIPKSSSMDNLVWGWPPAPGHIKCVHCPFARFYTTFSSPKESYSLSEL